MYVPGKMTVALNTSGQVLTLQLKTRVGGTISLHPRKGINYFDIEELCAPEIIEAQKRDLEFWTQKDWITWHPKGSHPDTPQSRGMRLPEVEGESVIAPPNQYDKQINELIEKDIKEDDRTKASSSRRTLQRAVPGEAPAVISKTSAGYPNQTRFADASKGEIDAGAGTGSPRTRYADAAQGEVDGATMPDTAPGDADLRRQTTVEDKFTAMGVGELFETALAAKVIAQAGPHYKFGEIVLGHGKTKAIDALDKNRGLADNIRDALRKG
jgi:hypothetical protein